MKNLYLDPWLVIVPGTQNFLKQQSKGVSGDATNFPGPRGGLASGAGRGLNLEASDETWYTFQKSLRLSAWGVA